MTLWTVLVVDEAGSEIQDAPPQIRRKFDKWVVAVQGLGPWLKGGWRTEALKGVLKDFYSVRLNRQWRVIFQVQAVRKVVVIRIVAHDYKGAVR